MARRAPLFLVLGLLAAASGASSDPAPAEPVWQVSASGLAIAELAPGEGAPARAGQTVEVHYVGWLADGTPVDSTRERGRSYVFALGSGMAIAGFDEGVTGMRVGGRRALRLPAALAYADRGAGGVVPPGADLRFDVELVAIR